MARRGNSGLTVLEVVLPIVLVALAYYVLTPELNRLLSDAKDSGVKGALAGLRAAISLSVATISVREENTAAFAFPTAEELNNNKYTAEAPAFHVKLNGTPIFVRMNKTPKNPWTDSSTVHDCKGMEKGALLTGERANDGWCYDSTRGILWANSNLSTAEQKENSY